MSSVESIAGTKLTFREMHTIIRSGENFSVQAIDVSMADGPRRVAFEAPYGMEMDVDYAFKLGGPSTTPVLWEIEQVGAKTEFLRVRAAARATCRH